MAIAKKEWQVCVQCVMDTSDPSIMFDERGVCDHCLTFEQVVLPQWQQGTRAETELSALMERIRSTGRGHDFDCILGLSGGLDSSYMLHKCVTEYGLKPLVFHVDGGWNTDLAVGNITVLVDALKLDLYTEVIDWEDMRDFQLGFFRSGVSQLDIPQDHAFVATLYRFANKYGIKHIMNGGNIATEGVRNPLEWLYHGTDMRFINDIRKRFCQRPLKNYPFSSIWFHKVFLRYVRGVSVVRPLNLMPYIKTDAENELAEAYGWRPYPQKHFESRFTRFLEGFWLPTRFGYDTRKVQFSSLILSGQMDREEALERLRSAPLTGLQVELECDFVASKLGISVDELMEYHTMPKMSFRDYRNQSWMFDAGGRILRALGAETALKR